MYLPQLDPTLSPTGAELEGEQPRLFDEFNDDDDDEGGYGYGAAGAGKSDGAKVILVAPNRSPAVPLAKTGAGGCCGGPIARNVPTTKGEGAAGTATEVGDGDNTAATLPVPVLVGGWVGAGASAIGRHLQARRDSEDARHDEEEYARRAFAADAASEGDEQSLLDKGQRVGSGTEASRVLLCVYHDGP